MTFKWGSYSSLPASACLWILVSQCKDSALMSHTITSWIRCNLTYYFQQIIRLGVCSIGYIKFKEITTEPSITRTGVILLLLKPFWPLSQKKEHMPLRVLCSNPGVHCKGPSIQSQTLQWTCEFTTNCWSYFTLLVPSEFRVLYPPQLDAKWQEWSSRIYV